MADVQTALTALAFAAADPPPCTEWRAGPLQAFAGIGPFSLTTTLEGRFYCPHSLEEVLRYGEAITCPQSLGG